MTSVEKIQAELQSWLETVFKKEELENLELSILGSGEKGGGYIGDIAFVEVSGTTKNGNLKKYKLVLKCSKRSQKLREKSPVKQAFLNEIYFYNVVLPSFLQFQKERNIEEPFEKVPKCYGTLSTGTMEIIALENLKSKGYILWDGTKPLTRKHIEIVLKQYAKFHAVSIAMKNQEPEKFHKLVDGLDNVLDRFFKTTELVAALEGVVQESYNLLQADIDKDILEKWLTLKSKARPFYNEIYTLNCLKLISHGDCWSNNFMHFHKDNEPIDVSILDWQMMTYSSPILDLSYFLFACLSKEDMDDFDVILDYYRKSFADHLRNLGSDPDLLYPKSQFLDDWKKYSKYGIIMSTIIHKFSLSEEHEVPDMSEAAENGEDVTQVFTKDIKNTADFRKRMEYIVKFAVKNNLI